MQSRQLRCLFSPKPYLGEVPGTYLGAYLGGSCALRHAKGLNGLSREMT